MNRQEEWRDVDGYPYEVSDQGRLRRTYSSYYTNSQRYIRGSIAPNGYVTVKLCHGPKTRSTTIHAIVAEAFIPNPEAKPEVNHKNFKRQDNRAANLEWVTRAENVAHARKYRKNYGNASFNKMQIKAIRELLDCGASASAIARVIGCNPQTISNIKNRLTWADLDKAA